MVLRFYCIVLMFKTRSFDRIIRLSPRESEKNALSSRLQNGRFFLKISKEIGKVVRKSLKREAREPHTPVRRVRREKKPSISIASLSNVVYKVEDQKWVEVAVRQQSLCLLLEGGVSRKCRGLRINCRFQNTVGQFYEWMDKLGKCVCCAYQKRRNVTKVGRPTEKRTFRCPPGRRIFLHQSLLSVRNKG